MKQHLRPCRALLRWIGALAAVALVPGVLGALGRGVPPELTIIYWSALLALIGVALVDAAWVMRLPSPRLQRQLSGSLSLGRWSDVHLTLQHDAAIPLQLRVFDHATDGLAFEHLPQQLKLEPEEHAQLTWRVRPLRRGRFTLERCEVWIRSPMGLWETRRLLALPDAFKVYPDFARPYDNPLQGLDTWLSRAGVRQQPRRGLGMEFHQLREFREGDSLRQIDWKATARHRTPIAREYQDERDQQILFMLDCGRRMRSQDGERSHFDHALNACLLLSHVALRQGDAVGLSSFAGDADRHLAPAKGTQHMNLLLDAVCELDSTRRPSDYSTAVKALLTRQKRRALVIMVTNLRDEDDEDLLAALRQLGQRQRVLVASLREDVLDRLRGERVERYEQALTYCATVDFLNQRGSLHERLEALGVPVIDARPQDLGVRMVNLYLSWKSAGAL